MFSGGEVPLHYVEGPRNGPDLVFLHGMARDWHSFSVLLPELTPHFHLLLVDLRGHGRSGRVQRGYRISDFATDVSMFLREVTPDVAMIFGHSLGAMVAMYVAGSEQGRIKALIVGDSMISPTNLANSSYHSLFAQLRTLILRGGSEEEMVSGVGQIEIHLQGLSGAIRLDELIGNTPTLLHEWARTAALTDPDVLAMALDGSAFEGWHPRNILPRIDCPTLLLQANPELDGLLTDSDVRLAVSLLPCAEHVKFPLLGHALFMQQPKPVLEKVLRFLGKLP